MKDIEPKLIELLKEGYCTPLVSQIAKKLKDPSTTIHYNVKRLEQEGAIKSYKAVFDYAKIGQGFCAFIMLKLSPDEYGNPEKIGKKVSEFSEIESVDIVTGDYEMILKARVKDQDAFYEFVKKVASIPGVTKTYTSVSFKQLKTEFVKLD